MKPAMAPTTIQAMMPMDVLLSVVRGPRWPTLEVGGLGPGGCTAEDPYSPQQDRSRRPPCVRVIRPKGLERTPVDVRTLCGPVCVAS